MIERDQFLEIIRYIINGLVATAAHYGAFLFNLSLLPAQSAGLANFLAAFVGIVTSFIGGRYFVFRNWQSPLLTQFLRFGALYASIAVLSGVTLFLWSDLLHFDQRAGFLIGVLLQVVFSYFGGKKLVFA
ncbi:MAG: GtrA family protein [Methylocystis sp.]